MKDEKVFLKSSLKTGLSFGLTSGVITTLGLMVGLHSGTHSKSVVLGGILTIAVADSLSDALGIHVAEESKNHGSHRDIWEATLATFYRIFGDVRPSAEVIGLLRESHQDAAYLPTSSRNRP